MNLFKRRRTDVAVHRPPDVLIPDAVWERLDPTTVSVGETVYRSGPSGGVVGPFIVRLVSPTDVVLTNVPVYEPGYVTFIKDSLFKFDRDGFLYRKVG